MSLLRIGSRNPKSLSEVPVEVRLFLWRRFGTPGRTAAQGISWRAHRPAGPRYGAHKAAVSGNARRVCGRSSGHSRWHTDAGEGTRFSASHTSWRRQRRFFVEPAGFSRRGTDISVADASSRARGARRFERARADSDILSRALRDPGRCEAGLQRVLRARIALPADDGLSAVHFAGQRDRAGYQLGEGHPLVAAAFRIFFTAR